MGPEPRSEAEDHAAPICPVPPESALDAFAAILGTSGLGQGPAYPPTPIARTIQTEATNLRGNAPPTAHHAILDAAALGKIGHLGAIDVASGAEPRPEPPASVRHLPVPAPPVFSPVEPPAAKSTSSLTDEEDAVLALLRIIERLGGASFLSPVERASISAASAMFDELSNGCREMLKSGTTDGTRSVAPPVRPAYSADATPSPKPAPTPGVAVPAKAPKKSKPKPPVNA